jgi:hypothetical protein
LCFVLKLDLPGFAGAERGSCISQVCLNRPCERMRATEHAPRGLFRVLERRHGLAEIVERGAFGSKFCYNILYGTLHIAARRGPVARRRRHKL